MKKSLVRVVIFASFMMNPETGFAHTKYVVIEEERPTIIVHQPAPETIIVHDPAPEAVIVQEQPPALMKEERGDSPGSAYVWLPGYWKWEGKWKWKEGKWKEKPTAEAEWIPGSWEKKHHHWEWKDGHWK